MRFINGLSLNIANKVDLQPYLSFDDVCYIAIKVEKQLKGRKSFHISRTKGPFIHNDIKTLPPQIKALNKGKGVTTKPFKRFEEKKCLKRHGFGHFQADCLRVWTTS